MNPADCFWFHLLLLLFSCSQFLLLLIFLLFPSLFLVCDYFILLFFPPSFLKLEAWIIDLKFFLFFEYERLVLWISLENYFFSPHRFWYAVFSFSFTLKSSLIFFVTPLEKKNHLFSFCENLADFYWPLFFFSFFKVLQKYSWFTMLW